MRKKIKIGCIFALFLAFCICMYIALSINFDGQKKEAELMDIANNIVNTSGDLNDVDSNLLANEENKNVAENSVLSDEELFSVDQLNANENVIGKIIIPKISVEAPIQDGTTADVLKNAVGHFTETNYWNGNVALASHNRGSYAHYFQNINKLENGDEIIYETTVGTKNYVVDNVREIDETDLSELEDTDENCLTLITCITNKRDKRLCVRAVEA